MGKILSDDKVQITPDLGIKAKIVCATLLESSLQLSGEDGRIEAVKQHILPLKLIPKGTEIEFKMEGVKSIMLLEFNSMHEEAGDMILMPVEPSTKLLEFEFKLNGPCSDLSANLQAACKSGKECTEFVISAICGTGKECTETHVDNGILTCDGDAVMFGEVEEVDMRRRLQSEESTVGVDAVLVGEKGVLDVAGKSLLDNAAQITAGEISLNIPEFEAADVSLELSSVTGEGIVITIPPTGSPTPERTADKVYALWFDKRVWIIAFLSIVVICLLILIRTKYASCAAMNSNRYDDTEHSSSYSSSISEWNDDHHINPKKYDLFVRRNLET